MDSVPSMFSALRLARSLDALEYRGMKRNHLPPLFDPLFDQQAGERKIQASEAERALLQLFFHRPSGETVQKTMVSSIKKGNEDEEIAVSLTCVDSDFCTMLYLVLFRSIIEQEIKDKHYHEAPPVVTGHQRSTTISFMPNDRFSLNALINTCKHVFKTTDTTETSIIYEAPNTEIVSQLDTPIPVDESPVTVKFEVICPTVACRQMYRARNATEESSTDLFSVQPLLNLQAQMKTALSEAAITAYYNYVKDDYDLVRYPWLCRPELVDVDADSLKQEFVNMQATRVPAAVDERNDWFALSDAYMAYVLEETPADGWERLKAQYFDQDQFVKYSEQDEAEDDYQRPNPHVRVPHDNVLKCVRWLEFLGHISANGFKELSRLYLRSLPTSFRIGRKGKINRPPIVGTSVESWSSNFDRFMRSRFQISGTSRKNLHMVELSQEESVVYVPLYAFVNEDVKGYYGGGKDFDVHEREFMKIKFA